MISFTKEVESQNIPTPKRLKTFLVAGALGLAVLGCKSRNDELRDIGNDNTKTAIVREIARAQLINYLIFEKNRIELFNISADHNYSLKDREIAGLAAVRITQPKYRSNHNPKIRDGRDNLLLKVTLGHDARYQNFDKVQYPKEVIIAAGRLYIRSATLKELHIFSKYDKMPAEIRNAAAERLIANLK